MNERMKARKTDLSVIDGTGVTDDDSCLLSLFLRRRMKGRSFKLHASQGQRQQIEES